MIFPPPSPARGRKERKENKAIALVCCLPSSSPSMIPNCISPAPSIHPSPSPSPSWSPSRPQPKAQPASTQVPRGITHAHTHDRVVRRRLCAPPACVRAMQQNTRVQPRADTTGRVLPPLLQPIPQTLTGRLTRPPVRSLGRPTSPAGGVPAPNARDACDCHLRTLASGA